MFLAEPLPAGFEDLHKIAARPHRFPFHDQAFARAETDSLSGGPFLRKGVAVYSHIIITEMNKVANISEDNLAATEEVAATFEQQYAAVDTLKHAALDMRQMAEKLTEAAIKFKL